MRKVLIVGVLLALVLLWAAPKGHAEIGAIDTVPAATLLLPYFEVDLSGDPDSINTRFNIRNTGAAPALAHVTLFTDFASPTLAFDVFLTGFDVERIDVRALFNGEVATLGVDTVTGTEPPPESTTALFQDDFESGSLGAWTRVESRISRQDLQAAHSGLTAPRTGNRPGFDHGDGLLRGYILVDNVVEEHAGFPTEAGYFVDGGNGIASNENVLTGEFEIVDGANNFSVGNPLVHIEASDTDPDVTTNGEYTFYGAIVGGTAADNRESLATEWRNRFLLSGAFDRTDLIYWRDPKDVQADLAGQPSWFPLAHNSLLVFDESENFVEVPFSPLSTPPPFPLACGRVTVGSDELTTPFDFGYVLADFNAVSDITFGSISQGFVLSVSQALGRFATGIQGMPASIAFDLTK